MVGEGIRFGALVKHQNPAIQIMHCCLHGDDRPVIRF